MKNSKYYSTLEPCGLYHIYTRGNNHENLFRQSENYDYFLNLWIKHIHPVAETYAYCLLPNHLHFCIRMRDKKELPETFTIGHTSLSQPFSNLFNAYTKAINKRFERRGSLFEKNYKRREIIDSSYLRKVITYIHYNPVHHKFTDHFDEYTYSSYWKLLSGDPDLSFEDVFKLFGDKEGFIRFHEVK